MELIIFKSKPAIMRAFIVLWSQYIKLESLCLIILIFLPRLINR